jgi:hypothetical protein
MVSKCVQTIWVRPAGTGQDLSITRSDLATPFAFERAQDHRGATRCVPLADFAIQEGDDLIRQSHGDLSAHTMMVPLWYAEVARTKTRVSAGLAGARESAQG